MDNLCHSLAGAAIAQSGFARRLPRATLLGVIAANIPDIDALVYLGSDSAFAVSFRRGWTHGLPALVVWAVLLAACFARWSRAAPQTDRPAGPAGRFTARDFLLLAAICVVSHPLLDLMNTYGIRLLMPFSDRWFYGDTLFIVDPPLLALLGVGALVSSQALRRSKPWAERPARTALALALVYVATMQAMSAATERLVVRELSVTNPSSHTVMIVPRPLSILSREVLVSRDGRYERSTADWAGLTPSVSTVVLWSEPIGADSATVASVRSTTSGERFLRWARFPYFIVGTGANVGTVFVGDRRYTSGDEESWAGVRVRPNAQEVLAPR